MDITGTFPGTSIYVASSWRNTVQPIVVKSLRNAGYSVYDFRDPNGDGSKGFSFSDIGAPNHDQLPAHDYIDVMSHELAIAGFERDMNALVNADIVVLVLPSERDAHLELGWAVGAGKQTHILLDNPTKASLMYKMVDFLHPNLEDLLVVLGESDG